MRGPRRSLLAAFAAALLATPATAAPPAYQGTQATPVICVDQNGNYTGCGGSGGSGSGGGAVYGPTTEGTAPANPPIFTGFKDGSGLIRGVAPATQLPVHDYDTRATSVSLSAAANSVLDIPVDGKSVVGLRFAGLTAAGATITFYSSNDATQTPTSPINSLDAATGATSGTRTTDGETRIPVSGRTTLRLQVTTAGTGTITVSYNVSRAGTIVDIGSPIPPGSNLIGLIGGAVANNADVGPAASGVVPAASYLYAWTGTQWQRLSSYGAALGVNLQYFNNGALSQTNPLFVSESAASFATSQASATATATLVCAARTGRRAATIQNLGTTQVFVGASGVTTGSGVLLPGTAGASITIPSSAAIYGVTSSGSQPVSCLETY